MLLNRTSLIAFALISIQANAGVECDYEIEIDVQNTLCVNQFERKYGSELAISKIVGDSIGDDVLAARNGFLAALEHPSAGIICWIGNGESFEESFQVVDFTTMQSHSLEVEPLPMSDELQCMVSDDEKYFLIYDDFPERELIYIYNDLGRLVLKKSFRLIENENTFLTVEGKTHHFSAYHEFGGFLSE